LTTFIDHRHKRAGVSFPGRPQGVRDGSLPRAGDARGRRTDNGSMSPKKVLDDTRPTQAPPFARGGGPQTGKTNFGPGQRGSLPSQRRVSWRSICCQMNLEPQVIHLSKNHLPQ
jgi:hypothetical protein